MKSNFDQSESKTPILMKTKLHSRHNPIFFLLAFTLALPHVSLSATGGTEGELLIKWKDGPQSYAAAAGNAQIGSRVRRNFIAIGWQLVGLPPGMSARDGVEAYRQLDTVLAAEPNGAVETILPPKSHAGDEEEILNQAGLQGLPPPLAVIPNDPRFSQQWNLSKIGTTNAWGTTTGSPNVVVAIIDTGVDYTHPDLAPNMWRNPGETGLDAAGKDKASNGIDDDDDGYVDDVHGVDILNGAGDPMDIGFIFGGTTIYHGTEIAGIIGAAGNNGTGICGINWSTRIMAVRMANVFKIASPRIVISHFIAAWDYVIYMKRRGVNIRVVNNSYGFFQTSTALADAISLAGEEGILAVFAALNHGIDQDIFSVASPNVAHLSAVINVANSTESDTLATDSNFGRSTVHLAAPGSNILSTIGGGGYKAIWGTSYACPHVVGAAALLLSVKPDLDVNSLKAAFLGSVDQPSTLRGKLISNGRLNIARALEYLTNANPPAIVISAAPAGQRTPTNAAISVTFNRPMNPATVESAFVVRPALSGSFQWSDDYRSFTYHNNEPLNSKTNYIVMIRGSALDAFGGTLDGNFNRVREGSPADDFNWTFRFPLQNDDFANSQALTGSSGILSGNNRYALLELDEPSHVGSSSSTIGASVWYSWIPANSGWTTFDLASGTAFDSLLAAYTGNDLQQLIPVAGNDNYGTRPGSRITFEALGGTRYSLVVPGKNAFDPNQAGAFTLTWYPTPPPGFTGAQFSPSSGAPGTRVTLSGTNFTGATAVFFNGASASFTNGLTNNLDLRITAIVPTDATSGPITVITPHGNVTSTASFQVIRPALTLTRTMANELTLSWVGTTFRLESSADLRTWTQVAPAGAATATVNPNENHLFFRLRAP